MLPKVLILALIASVLAVGQGGDNGEIGPEPIANGTVTNSTTSAPSTTPKASTTTTSTTPLTTTTTGNTSTTPTTTTTTTTTTAKSTTTQAPTTTAKPMPEPQIGRWVTTNTLDNVTCIIVEMAIQLNVTLHTTTNQTHYGIIDVPKTALVNHTVSSCGNESQVLGLYWDSAHQEPNILLLTFTKNTTVKHFALSLIEVSLSIMPEVKNGTLLNLRSIHAEFDTPVSMSYRCIKKQAINLTQSGSNDTAAILTVSHTQLQAFHDKENENFNAAQDCEPATSPDIVPIAVGCALVGLVAVVLIAYLVGRRQSRARGYLSM